MHAHTTHQKLLPAAFVLCLHSTGICLALTGTALGPLAACAFCLHVFQQRALWLQCAVGRPQSLLSFRMGLKEDGLQGGVQLALNLSCKLTSTLAHEQAANRPG
jgi:hypothetical protein